MRLVCLVVKALIWRFRYRSSILLQGKILINIYLAPAPRAQHINDNFIFYKYKISSSYFKRYNIIKLTFTAVRSAQ